jgi:hypothetical protein
MITAVTIGVGPEFARMARRAADSVQRSTGLRPIVIDQTENNQHPFLEKLSLLERFDGTILWFDADTCFLRPWDVSEFDGCEEVVGVQNPIIRCVADDVDRFDLYGSQYLNAGMFFATAAYHREVFAEAKSLAMEMRKDREVLWEQTALNIVMQRRKTPQRMLDARYNALTCCPMPDDPVVIHGAGGAAHLAIMERIIAESEPKDD